MEALQMLKFSIKKERLNFTSGWQTARGEMMPQATVANDDLLGLLLTEDREAVVDTLLTMCNDESDDEAVMGSGEE